MMNKLKAYYLPILSGFFIGTSYIPFPPWALFFALVPLWIFWNQESSYKKIFIAGWITQFALNLIGFHWISYTVMEFGRMPWFAGFAVLILFCSMAHLYYPIAGILWKWLCQRFNVSPTVSLLLLPFVFVLCERVYPFIFYWHFGYPWLWAGFPGYHVAEWIGFFGLNTLSLLINALFTLFWLQRRPKQWAQKYSVAALSLLVLINLAGWGLKTQMKPTDQSLKTLIVQGNIGNLEKIQASEGTHFIDHIVDRFVSLTETALKEHPDVDLVVWPETAFPEVLHKGYMRKHRRRLGDLTTHYDVELLTGAYQKKEFRGQIYNGLVLMKGNENRQSYQKTILLAFGEYFPFAQYYPKLKQWFPMVSDFGRGAGPTVFPSEKAQIGAQICYEGLFDEFSTELQKKGAQIIINVTNDSWFGYPFEPYQHMYMTLARAVENRVPLVRSTNTGISTVVHPDGAVQTLSPRNQEWYKVYDVPYHSVPPQTFYANISDKWPWILLFIIGALLVGDRIARTGKH